MRLTAKPIAIASDHRGFALKERLKAWLRAHDYAVTDCGAGNADERVDAMDFSLKAVREIKHGCADFAIGICGSGQMMAITANRFPFMRATLLHAPAEAAPAREHGDANMLALGADTIDAATAEQILETFSRRRRLAIATPRAARGSRRWMWRRFRNGRSRRTRACYAARLFSANHAITKITPAPTTRR
ncbi:MAG: RpiB/LacA/LacB family sugar-phosphate isomerase [Hyphomonadaceae bacterium]